ncbi:MAG TPA: PilZ domain-containing protein [Limnochordia bacterium]
MVRGGSEWIFCPYCWAGIQFAVGTPVPGTPIRCANCHRLYPADPVRTRRSRARAAEKRRSPRFRVDWPVLCQGFPGDIVDVSQHGLLARVVGPLSRDQIVALQIPIPTARWPLMALARVVRTLDDPEATESLWQSVGLEFVMMSRH